jgi:hypothetical protein
LLDFTLVVGILEARKVFFMNSDPLNFLALIYATVAIIAVGVALIIFIGNKPPKKD